ncbi:MAG: sugar ABC transporter permease [Oscillospiraceae bacterium]|nr:sugar ABC transporter permease [Oscillospiraceae bacterium]
MSEFNSKDRQDEAVAAENAESVKEAETEAVEAESVKAAETVETESVKAAESTKAVTAIENFNAVKAAAAESAEAAAAEGEAAVAADDGYAKRSGGKKPDPNKKTRISYEKKKRLYGYAFILLWFLGTIYMFIIPMVVSVKYSLSKTELVNIYNYGNYPGMTGPGIYCEWNNFKNYYDEFNTDQDFIPNLIESISAMPGDTFMILVFSLFIALLLNQKFKGRAFARAIFFIPVLVATGPVLSVINGDIGSQGIGDASQFSSLFEVDMVDSFLEFMGFANISQGIADQLGEIASDLFNLIWRCGIQTIIFLSALQQIPTAAKEAAQMEGATGWEFFWKITFPTISPMILANLIYTVIDCFIDAANPVMKQVLSKASQLEYGMSTAMAWTYFLIVGVALGIIAAIVSKFVFYQVD